MGQLVGIHGMAKHQLGRHQLLASWAPALTDGLERATGRPIPPPSFLDIAFYGDLFLPAADAITGKGARDEDQWWQTIDDAELSVLVDAAAEAVTPEDLEAAERTAVKAYSRVPPSVQVVLRALDRRFGAAAGILHLGVLRQVRRYLSDPRLKAAVDDRVAGSVSGDCRVLIGHSLGSVVAYEHLRQHRQPGIELFLTLGSPLGLRMIRERLQAEALKVPAWVNIRSARDPVACVGGLYRWWPQVEDVPPVDNGADAHAVERYLSKPATGRALLSVLPGLAP